MDYAGALRKYGRYGHGRSMKKFWYNTLFEQIVRKLKMNLRTAGNIGSESSVADNAFMYSVIESYKLNYKSNG